MIHSGNIEVGHEFSQEEIHNKLGNDRVCFSIISTFHACFVSNSISFIDFLKKRAKEYAKQLFIEHFIDFRRERDFIESERNKSRNPDERVFFMEIDGMDQ